MGAVIKRKMADIITYKPDETFGNAQGLLKAIENRINLKLYIYEIQDITKVTQSSPKLKSIKGTFTLHEVLATK
ncbi:unnamed protein product [Didymodactylos carnosus]|uniref:Uncharacterized protein n=1 Tax=Didymodactylos carnosus TaxID=1234261 RepID=A0A814IPH1_9BILA|nr:unnamed protein product [Didymodactylos carnosus]CAF1026283.1 unnamed protein product [Didymodactylos carnosus]CAF3787223.1 unnamed protein product [Didymodactylos carnosus]CAF3797419.1 unnamed protein product [Didymodactylos carnosus]